MKKTYWHIVTWVHPSSEDGLSVGDVIGYDEKKNERYGHDSKGRGFYVKTKLAFLGALPADYHERHPEEARARLDLWKEKFMANYPGSPDSSALPARVEG